MNIQSELSYLCKRPYKVINILFLLLTFIGLLSREQPLTYSKFMLHSITSPNIQNVKNQKHCVLQNL